MKLILALLVLLPILLELAIAEPAPKTGVTLDYGRNHRNSRMSSKDKHKIEEDADDEDDEEDADDDADDEDSIYPPDFEKLFPNPDGKPAGPPGGGAVHSDHPTSPQAGRPMHGPASRPGPAALRGPVPQYSPNQRNTFSAPPARGHPPSRGPPPRRYGSSPRPHYRNELLGYDIQDSDEDNSLDEPTPSGRQMYIANNYYNRQNQIAYRPGTNSIYYQNRRVVSYPALASYGGTGGYYASRRPGYYPGNRYPGNRYPGGGGGGYYPGNRYPGGGGGYYPGNRYPGNRYPGNRYPIRRPISYYPRNQFIQKYVKTVGTPVVRARDGGVHHDAHGRWGRIPHPNFPSWSYNPAHGYAYNPQYVVDPTAMRSRRRFRYHPTQLIPRQRVPVQSGHWGGHRWSQYPWTNNY